MTGSCHVCGNVGCNCDLHTVVAGIDLSSKGCDIVLLDEGSDKAEWLHINFAGGDLLERIREIRDSAPTRCWWSDDSNAIAVGIERPAGKHGVPQVSMALGALLQTFPPGLLVTWFMPAEWRKACGMKGNVSKEQVYTWAVRQWWNAPMAPTTDATDAFCIAWATRSVLEVSEAA